MGPIYIQMGPEMYLPQTQHSNNFGSVQVYCLVPLLGLLLGSHTVSVRALCNGHHFYRLCLFCIKSRKLSETGGKVHHFYRKSGSPSKNMMSDFALEVAKYPKSSPLAQNNVQAYCLAPLMVQIVGSVLPCKLLLYSGTYCSATYFNKI